MTPIMTCNHRPNGVSHGVFARIPLNGTCFLARIPLKILRFFARIPLNGARFLARFPLTRSSAV
jgi:hypothetical protein